jgi:formylglycine-generating enzyme required for sulfatase activity
MGSSEEPSACCAPDAARSSGRRSEAAPGGAYTQALIDLDGGTFLMGSADADGFAADREGPIRSVEVAPFAISAHAVTNADFHEFVQATGHVTVAETDGWSFVFAGRLADDHPPTRAVAAAPWWRQVLGASWEHPDGPGSSWTDRPDHPVVHVSWYDAMAYCTWAGVRLPSEREWEYAARGGLVSRRFPWGDEFAPDGMRLCNVFDGDFPRPADGVDVGTVPVDRFAPNGFGLYNVSGNVWEWCSDPFDSDPAGLDDPRVIRGGSYMCHDSYCNRYRVGARSSNTPDSTVANLGFRVAR